MFIYFFNRYIIITFLLKYCFLGCYTGDIRLEGVGAANPYEGRVELCIIGQWMTICDDLWDAQDAQVVCRKLGYPSIGKLYFIHIRRKYNNNCYYSFWHIHRKYNKIFT